MNKFLLLIFFCSIFLTSAGQNIEVFGGLNKNDYYDNTSNEMSTFSRYLAGSGFSIGISYENSIDSIRFRFTVKYDNYKGHIHTSNESPAGYSITIAEANKSCIGLDIYPINFTLLKSIKINVGASLNYSVHTKITGYQSWSNPNGSGQKDFSENGSANNKFTFGPISRVAYQIKIHTGWYILPQYLFYYGLTEEFHDIPDVKSYRHYFAIGVLKML